MPAERDRTIDALTAAFAAGELTMEEFEKRVETANRTNDEIALRRLLADLPRFSGDMPAAAHTTTYTAGTTWSRDWKDYTDSSHYMQSHYGSQNRSGRLNYRGGKADQVAIFSSSRRVGNWTLPKRLDSVAIFGSCLIDLRQAGIPPQGGRIEAVGIFGSVQILVPPGLNVRVNGVPIMGSISGMGDIVGDPAAPWVDIEAVAIFGSVEVKVSK
jgi:hypothetical protein